PWLFSTRRNRVPRGGALLKLDCSAWDNLALSDDAQRVCSDALLKIRESCRHVNFGSRTTKLTLRITGLLSGAHSDPATRGRVGQNHERTRRRPRCRRADDRHVYYSRASAWCLHHSKQNAVDGPFTRRVDQ